MEAENDKAVQDEVSRALALLRRAALIMDGLAADAATRFGPSRGAWTPQRLDEASHAIHLALIAAIECLEDPVGDPV